MRAGIMGIPSSRSEDPEQTGKLFRVYLCDRDIAATVTIVSASISGRGIYHDMYCTKRLSSI